MTSTELFYLEQIPQTLLGKIDYEKTPEDNSLQTFPEFQYE